MTIKEAISILEKHQEWRLGADTLQTEPKKLTQAIETIIKFYKNERTETPHASHVD
jgi:hypothetical protein